MVGNHRFAYPEIGWNHELQIHRHPEATIRLMKNSPGLSPAKHLTRCSAGLASATLPHLPIAGGGTALVRAGVQSVSKPPKLHGLAGLGLPSPSIHVPWAQWRQVTHTVASSSSWGFLLAAEHDLIMGAELLGGRVPHGTAHSGGCWGPRSTHHWHELSFGPK